MVLGVTKLTIEPMTEADVARAVDIELASFGASDLGGERGDPRDIREARLREELARTWAHVRVAREASKVVGYVLFWHVVDELHLLNVAVAPTERRRGIGRELVRDVIDYGRSNVAVKVLLEVRAGNDAALRLYEGLGFTVFNVRKRYYSDGEDGIEMSLELARV